MSQMTEISDTYYKGSQEFKGIIFMFPKATASHALKTTHTQHTFHYCYLGPQIKM